MMELTELKDRLATVGADPDEYECPICNAEYGPSDSYPWHWPDEDCRAIREPLATTDCQRCEGTGWRKVDGYWQDCPGCEGSGKVRA